jgi:UDP-N-acetylglucosamine:LPS N-acetylglucosamine transferase
MKQILFISGSVGLGHVTRDLVIAREIKHQNPNVNISWIASDPAAQVLRDDGANVLPESDCWVNENMIIEDVSRENCRKGKEYSVNLVSYMIKSRKTWNKNVDTFRKLILNQHFDLVIGDETYEIILTLGKIKKRPDFIMLYDFIGLDPMSLNPLEWLIGYQVNRAWARGHKKKPKDLKKRLFLGEPEDILDRKFGMFLPNRKEHVQKHYFYTGYILPFQAKDYGDKGKIRKELGYGEDPLIIASIGGTSIGKPLLELCIKSYPVLKNKVRNIKLVLVCGPRLTPESFSIPPDIEIKKYVPALFKHFAASDLAIVSGGGTSTLELTALKKPFLYFPVENHCEQQIHVLHRLNRHKAGVKMSYTNTTAESLAASVIETLGMKVNYADIKTDGANRAAEHINRVILHQESMAHSQTG